MIWADDVWQGLRGRPEAAGAGDVVAILAQEERGRFFRVCP
jgi:hypothetical protein